MSTTFAQPQVNGFGVSNGVVTPGTWSFSPATNTQNSQNPQNTQTPHTHATQNTSNQSAGAIGTPASFAQNAGNVAPQPFFGVNGSVPGFTSPWAYGATTPWNGSPMSPFGGVPFGGIPSPGISPFSNTPMTPFNGLGVPFNSPYATPFGGFGGLNPTGIPSPLASQGLNGFGIPTPWSSPYANGFGNGFGSGFGNAFSNVGNFGGINGFANTLPAYQNAWTGGAITPWSNPLNTTGIQPWNTIPGAWNGNVSPVALNGYSPINNGFSPINTPFNAFGAPNTFNTPFNAPFSSPLNTPASTPFGGFGPFTAATSPMGIGVPASGIPQNGYFFGQPVNYPFCGATDNGQVRNLNLHAQAA